MTIYKKGDPPEIVSAVVTLQNTFLYRFHILYLCVFSRKDYLEKANENVNGFLIKWAFTCLSSLALCFCVSFPLQVPVLHNNSGPPLVGLVTISCHLVKEGKCPDLLGDSAESRAVVQQWLEHRVTKLDRCRKEDVKTFLKVYAIISHKSMPFIHVQYIFLKFVVSYFWFQFLNRRQYSISEFTSPFSAHQQGPFCECSSW